MTEQRNFNDIPILNPEDDQFGIDPFARSLATSIRKMEAPVGTAISINGKWGSGKSSAVNLIRYHLRQDTESEELDIVDFKCWWFRGEEALTLAFLQELNSSLEKTLGDKAKQLVPEIGRTLLQAGQVIGPAMNVVTHGIWSKSIDFAERFFPEGESIEDLFSQLSNALASQTKRFLVVIDDIDRLAPNEQVLVFRLVKSVGRLPNVIYLLVFDRDLAESAVLHEYPSEGPHFLEKIIQASFEIPIATKDDLNSAVLREVETQCNSPESAEEMRRFLNLFHDVVSPYIQSPRDIMRLSNSISVSWPPIAEEVNLADFVALETLRLNESKLYNTIRSNKERLCGTYEGSYGSPDTRQDDLQEFVDHAPDVRRDRARITMQRLFPRFENVSYSADTTARWDACRRVCSAKHFDTFFRMSIGDKTISIHEVNEFIGRCGDEEFVTKALREASRSIRRDEKSKIPLLFEELSAHASRIEASKFRPLLTAIFKIADEIDRQEDQDRGGISINNHLRIHWLIRDLTISRSTVDERSGIFVDACRVAAVGWAVDFASSAVAQHEPRRSDEPAVPPEDCLVRADCLGELRAIAVRSIEEAVETEALINHQHLLSILFRWEELSDDEGAAVRDWTSGQLASDTSVALLARAFTGDTWRSSMGFDGLGDRISMRHDRASIDGAERIIDLAAFRRRLEELEREDNLVENSHKEYITRFLQAWRLRETGKDR